MTPPSTPRQSPRPEIKVLGTSRNPEYNISSNRARFTRNSDGRRLPPMAQLNTYTGRLLAEEQTAKYLSYTEGVPPAPAPGPPLTRKRARAGSRDGRLMQERPKDGNDVGLAEKGVSGNVPRNLSDRDRLTSQRPRTNLSELLGGNSIPESYSEQKTPGLGRRNSEPQTPRNFQRPPCPDCTQSSSNTTDRQFSSISHICKTCHRFVPSSQITALAPPPQQPSPRPAIPPVPPTKPIYTAPICQTCISIPGYLYHEYQDFFPRCVICGHMTDEHLTSLMESEGEIAGLVDDAGKLVRGPSKELQDWCVFVSHRARDYITSSQSKGVKRSSSLAQSIASDSSRGSTGLRRSGAVRRTPTCSTESSTGSRGGLIPVRGMRVGEKPRYGRRFSFDEVDLDRDRGKDVQQNQPVGKEEVDKDGGDCGIRAVDGKPKETFEDILGEEGGRDVDTKPDQAFRRQPGLQRLLSRSEKGRYFNS